MNNEINNDNANNKNSIKSDNPEIRKEYLNTSYSGNPNNNYHPNGNHNNRNYNHNNNHKNFENTNSNSDNSNYNTSSAQQQQNDKQQFQNNLGIPIPESNIYYLHRCKIIHNKSIYLFYSTSKFDLKPNDIVKIETKHGLDLALFICFEKSVSKDEFYQILNYDSNVKVISEEITEDKLKNDDSIDFKQLEKEEKISEAEEHKKHIKVEGTIISSASNNDIMSFNDCRQRAKKAMQTFTEEIKKHNLNMKPVNAHFFMDDKKLIFYFIADGRVDFRELVRSLASIFKKRIELHQIGVRDEARFINGFGICGQQLCCRRFLNSLTPISIKMAKLQNAPLNTMKISGYCGRLLCCLSYEYDTYKDVKEKFPEEGSTCYLDGNQYVLYEINLLTKCIKLRSFDNRIVKLDLENFKYRVNQNNSIEILNYKIIN